MAKNKTIFKLIKIWTYVGNYRYPEFEIHRVVSYFSTLKKAEKELHEIVKYEEMFYKALDEQIIDDDDFDIEIFKSCLSKNFGFLIEEYIDDNSWQTAESRRSYLPDGSLLGENLLSETPNNDGEWEEFLGRPADKIRFNIGDWVEVLYRDKVSLEIVGNLPSSPERVRYLHERSSKRGYRIRLDYTDDAYLTFDEHGEHAHPQAVNLFPVRFEVSEELKKKLFSDEYLSYRAHYDNLGK